MKTKIEFKKSSPLGHRGEIMVPNVDFRKRAARRLKSIERLLTDKVKEYIAETDRLNRILFEAMLIEDSKMQAQENERENV